MMTTISDVETVVTRTFDAPRDLVFDAWTNAEHFAKWIGPRGISTHVTQFDVRPGGRYRFVQRTGGGPEHVFHGVYREVVRPERLVSTFVYEGAPQYEILNTMLLEERGGKTLMTLTSRFANKEHLEAMIASGMEEGMTEGFERMEEWLAFDVPQEPVLRIERTFDAPRDLVFACWTQPEHFKQWFMPEGFTVPHCTIDARPGGIMHFSSRWPEQFNMPDSWMKGIFREVTPPERIVTTQFFSDEDGNFVEPKGMVEGFPSMALMRVTFEDLGGRTKMIVEQTVPATIARKQGAFEGWNSSFDKLARYVEKGAKTG